MKNTTASITFVRTRNTERLQLRVNGVLVPLGEDKYTHCAYADIDARKLLARLADSLHLTVTSEKKEFSHARSSMWVLRAVLEPVEANAVSVALAADDSAEVAERLASDAEECGNPDASELRRDAQACAERAARLAEVACEVKRVNAQLDAFNKASAEAKMSDADCYAAQDKREQWEEQRMQDNCDGRIY
jgi:hypothetical protein